MVDFFFFEWILEGKGVSYMVLKSYSSKSYIWLKIVYGYRLMIFLVLKIFLNVKCYKFEYYWNKNILNCFLIYLLIVFVVLCLLLCKNCFLLINEVIELGKEDEILINYIGW